MPQGRPALLFPDATAWAVNYLADRFSTRVEAYAQDVVARDSAPDESVSDPWPASGRLVTVRDDGGTRSDFSRTVRLGVNVWTAKDAQAECADLANLTAALLDDSPGSGRVVAVVSTSTPFEVPDSSGRPHRYFTAELVFTGSALTA